MKCLNCSTETKNLKFCGSSCAAIYNNKTVPKRKPTGACKVCQSAIKSNRSYCETCWNTIKNKPKAPKTPLNNAVNYQRVKKWRQEMKAKAVAYKGGRCILCGYNKSNRALTFHHRDPSEKEFTIGSITVKAWDFIKKELEKCDLLCYNCHMEIHDGES